MTMCMILLVYFLSLSMLTSWRSLESYLKECSKIIELLRMNRRKVSIMLEAGKNQWVGFFVYLHKNITISI